MPSPLKSYFKIPGRLNFLAYDYQQGRGGRRVGGRAKEILVGRASAVGHLPDPPLTSGPTLLVQNLMRVQSSWTRIYWPEYRVNLDARSQLLFSSAARKCIFFFFSTSDNGGLSFCENNSLWTMLMKRPEFTLVDWRAAFIPVRFGCSAP